MDLKRGLHADTLAALVAGGFHPALLVYLDWPGGAVRAHTGAGDIDWGGETWTGVMGYGSVEVPAEAGGGVPSDTLLTMVVPEDQYDAVMAADIRNRPGIVYGAVTTERAGSTLVGEPFELFSGYMDGLVETLEDSEGRLVHVVRVALGSGPGMRSTATVVHSHEDQSAAYPSDTIGRLLIGSRDRQLRVIW